MTSRFRGSMTSYKSLYKLLVTWTEYWCKIAYIIVVSHVHPTVQHDVFTSDGDEDAAAADILSSTLEREQQSSLKVSKNTQFK